MSSNLPNQNVDQVFCRTPGSGFLSGERDRHQDCYPSHHNHDGSTDRGIIIAKIIIMTLFPVIIISIVSTNMMVCPRGGRDRGSIEELAFTTLLPRPTVAHSSFVVKTIIKMVSLIQHYEQLSNVGEAIHLNGDETSESSSCRPASGFVTISSVLTLCTTSRWGRASLPKSWQSSLSCVPERFPKFLFLKIASLDTSLFITR